MYEHGNGVLQDYTEAIKWYKLAAAKKDSGALNNLGYLYHNGLGVKKSMKEACKYYGKAAALNDPLAKCNMAGCLAQGIGVKKDYKKAKALAKEGYEQGGDILTGLKPRAS